MSHVLLINASPRGMASPGTRLATRLASDLAANGALCTRDLEATPLPALTADYAAALVRTMPFDAPVFAASEGLVQELEASTALVIATPVHNFTVPAALKLWIDHVLRRERTFAHVEGRKVGRLADRPVFVVASSGGYIQGPRKNQDDFFSDYLRCVLATLGLHSVRFVYLQGLATPDGMHVQAQIDRATQDLADVVACDTVL
ncbi:FMN-dependent NADH-azoreductase [Coralloluteibacterium stylophorae]|uniref:FMN dependent NADH:quinone oxidoreductase n=1 Tax=Coralloluteibacterium stylophorae TaxID=1776034 RepID=A0A8J7VT15_9GAMM|nr:NAD(P)H-dependent oxidoreductase [Coralloluteibacterium stylophorae]MBS7456009.1 NAD(P)H-dependent oxidoreductase [Coralloluteibacterium stylophorae]